MSALVVVDTSIWIDFFRGVPLSELETALGHALVVVPPIVVSELLSAPLSTRRRADLEALLRDLPLCDISFDHWSRVGALRARLRKRGISMSTPDAHVAQCAIDADAALWTRDAIFSSVARLAGLRLL
ncbi:MAG: PIN domain-containing protein [Myxococcota bacterium]|nr:PIN domain-containing protein [Myxococcota bacterium]